MTYRQLRKHLQEMDELRLDDDVSLYEKDSDEYYPALSVDVTDENCDVLDEGHTIIIF